MGYYQLIHPPHKCSPSAATSITTLRFSEEGGGGISGSRLFFIGSHFLQTGGLAKGSLCTTPVSIPAVRLKYGWMVECMAG